METNEQYQSRINADAINIFEYCNKRAIRNMPYDNIAADGEPYDILKETLKYCRLYIGVAKNNPSGAINPPNRQYWHDVKEAITAMYVPASMLVKKV